MEALEEMVIGGGAGSGGGSINIFYKSKFTNNQITAIGGKRGTSYVFSPPGPNAGNGGNGSITIGSISTGSFVVIEE